MSQPDTLRDDIRNALSSTSDGQAPGSVAPGVDDFGSPASETLPPVMPDERDAPKTPQRGPDGKFLPQRADSGTPPPPAPGLPPVGQPPPQAPEGAEELKLDPNKPPDSWTKPMKEKWGTLPPDVREEITRREEATAVGVRQLKQYYEPMEELYNTLAPFEQYFDHIQEDPRQYLHSMIGVEQTLRLGNPAQKMTMVLSLAEQYGVPLRAALDAAMGGKLDETMAQAHQYHQTPPQIPPDVALRLQELQQWKEQVEDQAAESELAEFVADDANHPYYEHVREDMADLIEYGYAEDYQAAYDLACWRNPQVRAHYIASYGQQPQPQGQIQQRHAAAAFVLAPGSAPLENGADQPNEGDDIHEAVRKAWNANATGRA